MERSEAFKNGVTTVKALEKQLKTCENIGRVCKQSAVEVTKEIEEHFAKCMNALAARKDTLLREVAQKVSNQKKSEDDIREKLVAAIQVCKQTMEAAVAMHAINPSAAEGICKELKKVPIPKVFDARVTVELPSFLLDDIHTHGKVHTGRFSIVETVSTLAGSGKGTRDGNGLGAQFDYPFALCMNLHDSCLYICDSDNFAIRKLSMQGAVSTFVQTNNTLLLAIAFNYKENVFFATTGSNTIVKITSSGVISTLAGSGQQGNADGIGTASSFSCMRGIAVDQQTGNLFVCDTNNHKIRKITSQGVVSTLAGSEKGFADGNRQTAKFSDPWGICYDECSQSLLVCDLNNNKLRRVKLNGDVSTLCEISDPISVVITANQSILVTSFSHQVFKVVQEGQNYQATVIAGSGKEGSTDGNPEECAFRSPCGIAVYEPTHSCFVAEFGNNAIRKIAFVNPNI